MMKHSYQACVLTFDSDGPVQETADTMPSLPQIYSSSITANQSFPSMCGSQWEQHTLNNSLYCDGNENVMLGPLQQVANFTGTGAAQRRCLLHHTDKLILLVKTWPYVTRGYFGEQLTIIYSLEVYLLNNEYVCLVST